MAARNLDPFSAAELQALQNHEFFAVKARATGRMRDSFAALRDALRPTLPTSGWLCRSEVDVTEGFMTTGEDYEGLPYVVMDFPTHLGRAEKLAMRTLFWWGHYVVYSLIIEGAWIPQALERLGRQLPALEAAGVERTVAGTPWDWRRGAGHSEPLGDDAATRAGLDGAPFVKLMRFLPLDAHAFTPAAIVDTGMESWALYAPLVTR